MIVKKCSSLPVYTNNNENHTQNFKIEDNVRGITIIVKKKKELFCIRLYKILR